MTESSEATREPCCAPCKVVRRVVVHKNGKIWAEFEKFLSVDIGIQDEGENHSWEELLTDIEGASKPKINKFV